MNLRKHLLLAVSLAPLVSLAAAQSPSYPGWVDTRSVRIQALALVQTLNANLLSSNSATKTLFEWCSDHHIATTDRIRAEVVAKEAVALSVPTQVRTALHAEDQPIAFRQVKLMCGEHVLSEADNWYVPSRLTPAMNDLLNNTDTPFGKAVNGLNFYRRTQAVERTWQILPNDWYRDTGHQEKAKAAKPLDMPQTLLRHDAILLTPDNVPFSYVVERYTRENLAFPLGQ